MHSKTFNHCFFIIPGVLYLIWLRREVFSRIAIEPNYWVLLPLTGVLLVGLVGVAGDVQLFQHFSAFAILPLITWIIFGSAIAVNLRFPLAFILFSIPVGEELVPFFQSITADMALAFLKVANIPVYRDGLYIEIPGGRFVVAEACSGIRFFVSMLAFGAVYVYLSFHTLTKKCMFFALALVIPIVANGFRVFGIILIAHLSDMKHAVGADHLVYGWIFQLITLLIYIAIGEYWREKNDNRIADEAESNVHSKAGISALPAVSVFVLLMVYGVWDFQLRHQEYNEKSNFQMMGKLGLVELSKRGNWRPSYANASATVHVALSVSELPELELFIAWYDFTGSESELISYANRLYRSDQWSLVETVQREVDLGGRAIPVTSATITSSRGQKREIVYWYEMDKLVLASPVLVKLYQSIDRLFGGSGAGAIIALSLPYSGVNADEKDRLLDVVKTMHTDFRAILPFKSS